MKFDVGQTKGITRSLDSLGRVVIPKEFRKELNLNEGDRVEMFLSKDGVFLKIQKEGE